MIGSNSRPSHAWADGWGELPASVAGRDIPGVAVDSRDRLVVFSRSDVPLVVLDRSGSLLAAWSHIPFVRPHSVHVAADDSIWCADDEGQRIVHVASDGTLIGSIDGIDRSSETGYRVGFAHSVVRSAPPFCYPTAVASMGASARVWVTDGYGNARVHAFDSGSSLISSWGEPGTRPLEFVIPHGVTHTAEGLLFISDRENERIQILATDGTWVGEWRDLNCPNAVALTPNGEYFVAELGRVVQGSPGDVRVVPDALPARVTCRDRDGRVLEDYRSPASAAEPDMWFSPHGIAANSCGDVYVGEVRAAYSQGHARSGMSTLHKLARVSPD